jgi:hypothetical protein
MREENDSRGLNAVGKPYSPSFDPNYKLKGVRTSTAHLRFPYLRMKFVGEELREASHHRQQPKLKEDTARKESSATMSYWKENTRKAEFTARAPLSIGGSYILSPFFNCWNVDYREKGGRSRRQLGLAHTLDEAKAIVNSWQSDAVAQCGGDGS